MKTTHGFTIKDLKKIIKGLDNDIPVILVNPVGMGNNEFIDRNIEINDAKISADGIAHTIETRNIKSYTKTKALLIYL